MTLSGRAVNVSFKILPLLWAACMVFSCCHHVRLGHHHPTANLSNQQCVWLDINPLPHVHGNASAGAMGTTSTLITAKDGELAAQAYLYRCNRFYKANKTTGEKSAPIDQSDQIEVGLEDLCIVAILMVLVVVTKCHTMSRMSVDDRPSVGPQLSQRIIGGNNVMGRRRCSAWGVAGFRKALWKWRRERSLKSTGAKQLFCIMVLAMLLFEPVTGLNELAPSKTVSSAAGERKDSHIAKENMEQPGNPLHEIMQRLRASESMAARAQAGVLSLKNELHDLHVENMALRDNHTTLQQKLVHLEGSCVELQAQLLKAKLCENCTSRDQSQNSPNRRGLQNIQDLCGTEGAARMLGACCEDADQNGGHRRVLQGAAGCASMPATCTPGCKEIFPDFFRTCSNILAALTASEYDEFARLNGQCEEAAATESAMGLDGARPAMMFHLTVVNGEAQSRMAAMFGRQNLTFNQGFLPVLGVSGSDQPSPEMHPENQHGAGVVNEFRRVCSKANLTVCAPECNIISDGYLLSILIDGRGTVMTCSQEGGVFSWIGQAALGSCITDRPGTWLENVKSHAAGTFVCTLAASVDVSTVADLIGGQSGIIHGSVAVPVWTNTGDGPAFTVGPQATLEMSRIVVAASSGLAFKVSDSALLNLNALQLQSGDGSTSGIACNVLAMGIGQGGLNCASMDGTVVIGGPLYVSTSGTGFGMGSTKYIGQDLQVFTTAVYTREPGLYSFQFTGSTHVTLPVPVDSAMHVSIIGVESMPALLFDSNGPAFQVAVAGYLSLRFISIDVSMVSRSNSGAFLTVAFGGEITIDHAMLNSISAAVSGSMTIQNTEITDFELATVADATLTLESSVVTGSDLLIMPIQGSAHFVHAQLNNVQLQIGNHGDAHVVDTHFRTEGVVIIVDRGGTFTVASSHLVFTAPAGSVTPQIDDPLPCNGHNQQCISPHMEAVVLEGPGSINTHAPIICPMDGGDCVAGYVDMASCFAGIADGVPSCVVFLQQNTPTLGVISVNSDQNFAIHGVGESLKISIYANWDVEENADLLLDGLSLSPGTDQMTTMEINVARQGMLRMQDAVAEMASIVSIGAVQIQRSVLVRSSVVLLADAVSILIAMSTLEDTPVSIARGGAVATIEVESSLTNSPVLVGFGSSLTIVNSELTSDESQMSLTVPLTVSNGAAVAVNNTVFRSLGRSISMVSVAAAGSFSVESSELVSADGLSNPFPCDGQIPSCTSLHRGAVSVSSLMTITTASPLVCSLETGQCSSSVCVLHPCMHLEGVPAAIFTSALQTTGTEVTWTSWGNGTIEGTEFPLSHSILHDPITVAVELWGGGARGSPSGCSSDETNGGAGAYAKFNLRIDPTVYGQYIFTAGHPAQDSFVSWNSLQIPPQTNGPLPSTRGMPGGPFTCEQLQQAGTCGIANGLCCTSCASQDPHCSVEPLELARAGAGTTGTVVTTTHSDTSHCNGCQGTHHSGSLSQGQGGRASVSALARDNSTVETDNTGTSAISQNGFRAGAGGAHATSANDGNSCQQHAPQGTGDAGLIIMKFT